MKPLRERNHHFRPLAQLGSLNFGKHDFSSIRELQFLIIFLILKTLSRLKLPSLPSPPPASKVSCEEDIEQAKGGTTNTAVSTLLDQTV